MAETSWKDHPLKIAFGSVVATVLFMIGIYANVIMPTLTKSLQNQLDDANRKIITLDRALTTSHGEIAKEASAHSAAVADLQKELSTLRLDGVFSQKDVYPLGYREIRIGDDARKVLATYGRDAIDSLNGPAGLRWIDVSTKKAPFRDVVYYRIPCNDTERISHILFHIESADRSTLLQKAIDAFGKDNVVTERSEYDGEEVSYIDAGRNIGAELDKIGLVLRPHEPVKCGGAKH